VLSSSLAQALSLGWDHMCLFTDALSNKIT
jgi:hypothetical protein